jgi:hypothetical protein
MERSTAGKGAELATKLQSNYLPVLVAVACDWETRPPIESSRRLVVLGSPRKESERCERNF